MIYGLDSNVANPPFSALLSLMLIAGFDALGLIIARKFGLLGISAPAWHRWQSPILAAMTMTVMLYPIVLAGLSPRWFLQAIAVCLLALGIFHTANACRKILAHKIAWICLKYKGLKEPYIWGLLLVLPLTAMCFVALAPVTNADSFTCHIGVALSILNNGAWPFVPEWFTGRLAGNGEVLIALGLSVGAEQFGSLLQFIGLLGIVGLLLGGEVVQAEADNRFNPRLILAVAAVSAPTLLFLVSSPKPQLLPISMTCLALALMVYPSRRQLTTRMSLLGFTLISLLLMTASQTKLSFLLSAGVLGMVAFVLMCRRRLFLPSIGIVFLVAAVAIVPALLWKHYYYGCGFIEALIKPLPGNWPGSEAFDKAIRACVDGTFPLTLLLPSGIGTISTTIGAGLVLILGLRPGKDRWVWMIAGIAFFVTIVATILGQRTSRFFLEPYLWMLIALLIAPVSFCSCGAFRWLRWLVLGQALMTAMLALYGAVTLFPGALTPTWRSKVMDRCADGHMVMKWADSVLPKDAVLLSMHSAVGLAPRDVVSSEFLAAFTDFNSAAAMPYVARLKQRRVSHILIIGAPQKELFSNCLGPIVAGPFQGHRATRNPFNIGEPYDAWIYQFELANLPGDKLSPSNKR